MINEKSVSENIKKYRKLSKLTQKQLADMTNSNEKYISELERGRGNLPSIEMLYKIAEALKTTPDLLIYENLSCRKVESSDIQTMHLNKNTIGFTDSKLQFVLDVINSVKNNPNV